MNIFDKKLKIKKDYYTTRNRTACSTKNLFEDSK